MKIRGGLAGVILVVALLGYMILSGQLFAGQLIEELLGGGGSRVPATAQSIPSTEAAQRQLSQQVAMRLTRAAYSLGYHA